jgi:hypothetical protein
MKDGEDKIYHIYEKGQCVYPSLSRSEFERVWDYVKRLTWVSDINENDLDYEELAVNEELVRNSSY